MKMSKLVGKSLPEFPVSPDGQRPEPHASVGIEVEVEGIRADTDYFKYWDVAGDGSLQGGIEFISKPVWGTAIGEALLELGNFFAMKKPYISFRTSVHVHLNILDIDTEALTHLMKAYVFYEAPLFRLHSEWNRYENIFCVPTYKSTAIQEGYARLFRELQEGRVRGDYVGYKYSALNPNCIPTLGTVEFRHMGGTSDVNLIDKWINILLQLKWAAKNNVDLGNPKAVFGDYYKDLDIRGSDLEKGHRMMEYINLKTLNVDEDF